MEGKNWARIPVEVFVDIMMQILHLEILKWKYLENIVQHVIWI
jgi:hypothetical protein